MSIIRWGHFSDLHFQFERKGFNTSDLRDKLIEKIGEYAEKNGKFDYVFITGDIFHKGQNESKDIDEAIEYIKKIRKAAACELKNIFLCIGNHDLKRSKVRKQNLNHVIEEYEKNKSLQYNGYYVTVVEEVCKPFIRLCNNLYENNRYNSLHYYVDLGDINLYVLNTSIFAGQTYPEEKNAKKSLEDTNLFICDEHLLKLKQTRNEKKRKEERELNIVLAHHGTECFQEQEKRHFLNFLRDIGADLYLCGHVHQSIVKTLDEADGAYQCSCGGLFSDSYNTPSFIIGEYNTDSGKVTLRNYQYIVSVNAWRPSNSLTNPYDENGIMTYTPKKFEEKEKKYMEEKKRNLAIRNATKKQYQVVNSMDPKVVKKQYNDVKKVSNGLDRDKDFIEIRERASKSITILGAGMSKLSRYALYGMYSLDLLSKKMDVHIMMLDPNILENNSCFANMCEDFFGIDKFAENVRTSYDILKKYCDAHNSNSNNKYKIILSTYSTIPTMSAVIIDEETQQGEIVIEYFGYHCGQNRPLLLIQKNGDNGLFECVKEQINMLKKKSDVKSK